VPTNGFYEWKKLGTTKQPYLLTMADANLFAFADLWERWRDPVSGAIARTFTIVTTEPNELAARIHNRMPAIIGPTDYGMWLGEEPVPKDELLALLRPFPAERMRAYPMDRRVGNPKNDDASLIEPLGLTGSL
jgi:putative SOS response-associated peptidase YedK